MIAPDGTNLGNIIYEVKKFRICELGVCDDIKSIIWDDVEDLRIDGKEVSVGYRFSKRIVDDSPTNIDISDFSDKKIHIHIRRSMVDLTGRKKQTIVSTIMEFIMSKIFDRQWKWFMEELRSNRPVSFYSFEITPNNIRKKKKFGEYITIDLHMIIEWEIKQGRIYISYYDDKGKELSEMLGMVKNTKNLHLYTHFLNTLNKRQKIK